jgi:hypothetical protein
MTTAHAVAEATGLLYRFEGELTGIAPIGVTHAGARMDASFAADVVAGELAGGRLRGVDYFTLRPDGVGVVDARFAIEAPEGVVHCHARGYVTAPPGAPALPLEAVLSPGFAWPDVDLAITEFALCETGAPALAHLNRTVAAARGAVNMATGRLVVESRALAR